MRKLLVLLLLLLPFTKLNAQVFKFRVKQGYYSDSLKVHEESDWKNYNAPNGMLVVYDGIHKKITGYGKNKQDLSIITSNTFGDKGKGWSLTSMKCVDQENRECEVSIIVYTLPNKEAPSTDLIIDYTVMKFKFKMQME